MLYIPLIDREREGEGGRVGERDRDRWGVGRDLYRALVDHPWKCVIFQC